MFKLVDTTPQSAVIKVVGVGGGGGNAVEHMVREDVDGVDFICANTDAQALQNLTARTLLQLGSGVTKGLGAGANPDMGKDAALEDKDRIAEVLDGADMVFVTAGMGGGTGTGAAPVVAEIARNMGILAVAVVTKPFAFEGRKRMSLAEAGIAQLSQYVDSLITIPNEKLLSVMGDDTPLLEAFAAVDGVLSNAVQGIADLIIRPGMINVDFADVRTVMSEMGMAMMGSGLASGEDRAVRAAEGAIRSPLLDEVDFNGARGILVNIAANEEIALGEFSRVGATIENFASENATVVIGTVIDPDMTDEMRVTVVATGLGEQDFERPKKVVDNTQRQQVSPDAAVNYSDFEKPAVSRRKALETGETDDMIGRSQDMEYLDIPAFIRRQAD
ncbi:MAG: cell division protein FtsZ [OM182 bacterium MED-G24]|uniref:Cell division protein FtsZ n=1 Tax=OM182 bacterium MED-G24 TaxID=1986255 RepID=A0A2A5WR90_9GAMM|nr:MAG: cell division protein FtsZ [OM182 bacterium MED-G24]